MASPLSAFSMDAATGNSMTFINFHSISMQNTGLGCIGKLLPTSRKCILCNLHLGICIFNFFLGQCHFWFGRDIWASLKIVSAIVFSPSCSQRPSLRLLTPEVFLHLFVILSYLICINYLVVTLMFPYTIVPPAVITFDQALIWMHHYMILIQYFLTF